VHHGVSIDVCSHCGGMWLDAGELEQLASHEDRPGLLGRVIGDVLTTLRRRERPGG
jgi:Zn-finger nucleic acid-binding protein